MYKSGCMLLVRKPKVRMPVALKQRACVLCGRCADRTYVTNSVNFLIMHRLPESLSAKFKDSFAYKTVKDRLPVIVTKIVDIACRHRHEIQSTHGDAGWTELQRVIHELSEMRYRLSTDKPLTPFHDRNNVGFRKDLWIWNKCLQDYETHNGVAASWFKSPWLLVECYMYRKIVESFENTVYLRNFDPFSIQKEQAFVGALPPITILADHVVELIDNFDEALLKANVINLMQICLWGNKCDLSISAGANAHYHACPLSQVATLKPYILVDNLTEALDFLMNHAKKQRIDIVLDNAGMEFFGDLCFAEYLLTSGLTKRVVFHCKSMPWFVSDTTIRDFSWTIEMLNSSDKKSLTQLAGRWLKRQEDGSFDMKTHDFWTLPYSYYEMQSVAPDLYADLSSSDFLFFKGDLNYRKLVGDLNWPPATPFGEAIQQFCPAPLLSLRTLKADVVAGLTSGQAEKLSETNEDWMTSGDYAVIQFFKLQ